MFQHKLHPAWVPRVIAPQSGPRWKSGPQNHLPVKNVWTKLHYLLDPGFTELLVIPMSFWILARWVLILHLWYYSVLSVWQHLVVIMAIRNNSPHTKFLVKFLCYDSSIFIFLQRPCYGELRTEYYLLSKILNKTVWWKISMW